MGNLYIAGSRWINFCFRYRAKILQRMNSLVSMLLSQTWIEFYVKIVNESLGSFWLMAMRMLLGHYLPFAETKVPVFGSELSLSWPNFLWKTMIQLRKFNDFMWLMRILKLSLVMWSFPFSERLTPIPESLGVVIKTEEGNIVYTETSSSWPVKGESYDGFGHVWLRLDDGVLCCLSDLQQCIAISR